jgi:hypothetical protein
VYADDCREITSEQKDTSEPSHLLYCLPCMTSERPVQEGNIQSSATGKIRAYQKRLLDAAIVLLASVL